MLAISRFSNDQSTASSYQTNHQLAFPDGNTSVTSIELENDDEMQPTDTPAGETASDPEFDGGRQRVRVDERKKRFRWDIEHRRSVDLHLGHLDELPAHFASTQQPPTTATSLPLRPRRRRSRSFSGEELFDYKAPLATESYQRKLALLRSQRASLSRPPTAALVARLPILEGDAWQDKPFSPSSGVPTILKRPSTQCPTGPNEEQLTVSFPSLEVQGSTHNISFDPVSPSEIPSLTEEPSESITAPSSPFFPPLPTPVPSAVVTGIVPKFKPPNPVQSPKLAIPRTLPKDRSASELLFLRSRSIDHNPSPDLMYKSIPSRISRPAPALMSNNTPMQRSNSRRQQLLPNPSQSPPVFFSNPSLSGVYIPASVHPSSSGMKPTQPSPPNPVSLTTSPRSPVGHSISPHTPQSSMLSPVPTPSISILDENQFEPPHRAESPPWRTVKSGSFTSPRLKPNSAASADPLGPNPGLVSLIKSPPVTPFTSVHLQIDELPNEGDSDQESIRPSVTTPQFNTSPIKISLSEPTPLSEQAPPQRPITPVSVSGSVHPSPRPEILSPSPPIRLDLPPETPPMDPFALPLSTEAVEEALDKAIMPWPIKEREAKGIMPIRKIVKRVEKGEWENAPKSDQVPRESALWRLIRAQRLWIQGNQDLFKLKHPSGVPRDHKSPKTQYVDDGEPYRAIEVLVRAILLDPRVVAFKSMEARRDFIEQLAWQIFADSKQSGWPELNDDQINLDDLFAQAEARAHGEGPQHSVGPINTRRGLAGFIRSHVVLAILEEQDGFTQRAVLKYGRALDTIVWVNQTLGAAPDKILYGKGDAKERVESVFDGVFARGVQIRLGHTLIAQYNYIKREAQYQSLRNDLLAELLQGSMDLFESVSQLVMNPYVNKNLKLEVYISDFVYHVAHAHFFQGFYARETAKIILDMNLSSPRTNRPASEVARERSASAAKAFTQAALLFPDDEEERIQCFEMALEEMLKVGGLRVAEALAMYDSLKDAQVITDRLWNYHAPNDDEDGEDVTSGLFDDDSATAKKKKKKKKKKKDTLATDVVEGASTDKPSTPVVPTTPRKEPGTPKTPALLTVQTPQQKPALLSSASARSVLLDRWFGTLRRNRDEQRIMGGDLIHAARNLRGRPEIVWKDFSEEDAALEDEADGGSIPWASWGMRSVKATKWEDLIKEENGKKKKTLQKDGDKAKKVVIGGETGQTPPSTTTTSARNTSPQRLKPAIKSTKRATISAREFEESLESIAKISPELSELVKSADIEEMADLMAKENEVAQSPLLEGKDIQLKPAASEWERPTPWSIVQRLSKQKLFAIALDAFSDGARK